MPGERSSLYAAVWRWHFYAGLFVAPFFVLLAATGLVMLFSGPIERWQLPELARQGPPARAAAPHQARLEAASAALPGARLVRYSPGGAPGEPTRVEMELAGTPRTVYVDEATGRALGHVPTGRRLGVLAERLHGTLLLGDFGDRMIETAAGFGVLLLVSGLYLWWPRRGAWRQALTLPAPRSPRSRPFWRGLHRWVGSVLAPVLLFYLISGLAWTGIWGGRLVQAWNTFPAEKAGPVESGHDHSTFNGGARKAVPWNLEQAPLPAAPLVAGKGRLLDLDEAVAAARSAGIGPRFWAGFPDGRDDVWTVAQTGLGGEVTDPRDELTVHVDRRTGRILGHAGWREYGLGARAMAAGIPLHAGHLGTWNTAASALVCLLVLLLALSGPLMWWLRRPSRTFRLAAPPAPPRVPKAAWAVLALLCLALPLTAAAVAAVALADRLLFRRLPLLREVLE